MNKLIGQNATVIHPRQIRKLLEYNPNYGTAYDKGYREGYQEGYQEGYIKGFAEGFKIGFEEGMKHFRDKFIQAMKQQGFSDETIAAILQASEKQDL